MPCASASRRRRRSRCRRAPAPAAGGTSHPASREGGHMRDGTGEQTLPACQGTQASHHVPPGGHAVDCAAAPPLPPGACPPCPHPAQCRPSTHPDVVAGLLQILLRHDTHQGRVAGACHHRHPAEGGQQLRQGGGGERISTLVREGWGAGGVLEALAPAQGARRGSTCSAAGVAQLQAASGSPPTPHPHPPTHTPSHLGGVRDVGIRVHTHNLLLQPVNEAPEGLSGAAGAQPGSTHSPWAATHKPCAWQTAHHSTPSHCALWPLLRQPTP